MNETLPLPDPPPGAEPHPAAQPSNSLNTSGLRQIFGAVASTANVASMPRQIGNYRILDVLGHGGMGVVYRAEQANPRREVALKVIGSSFVTPELLKRFDREAHLLGRLKHSGIAQVHEA